LHILFTAKQYFGNPDLVRLSAELANKTHHISVVTSFREGDRQIRLKNVDIHEAPPLIRLHNLSYPVSFPVSQLYKIVRSKDVDIIHGLSDFSTHTASAASISTMTNVPFVYTIQNIGWRTNNLVSDTLMKLYEWSVELSIARKADKVILLSERLMPRAKKLNVKEDKIAIVPPGVDCNYFDPERPEVKSRSAELRGKLDLAEDKIIGYVGRLLQGKGMYYLISAMKRLKDEHSDVTLLIIGDGPERASLERMTTTAGIKAIFAGWQNDVLPYYSVMDVFVLPSLFEGVPNVLLEAMAMRKPAVATNVGGNADLVENGVNGFLVSARDPQQIACALEKLIENGDLRSRFGRSSREKVVKLFSLDKTVERVERVYNEIV